MNRFSWDESNNKQKCHYYELASQERKKTRALAFFYLLCKKKFGLFVPCSTTSLQITNQIAE
jgi:hypothetical protein